MEAKADQPSSKVVPVDENDLTRKKSLVGPTPSWEDRYQELCKYRDAHHHCNVPKKWAQNPQLAGWVKKQRDKHKKGKLTPDQITMLESIGFRWSVPPNSAWEKRYQELCQYRDAHHHCNVPKRWAQNPPLGPWAHKQRQAYKNRNLSTDRITMLESIGFKWSTPPNSAWEKRYEELCQYRDAHHHCNVPDEWAQNPQLGRWVHKQRQNYKKGMLAPDRITMLESIGFTWSVVGPNSAWEDRYQELCQYRDAHHHCNVPKKWAQNPQLASWVRNQRDKYKKGKLTPDQITMLESIGFRWTMKKGPIKDDGEEE